MEYLILFLLPMFLYASPSNCHFSNVPDSKSSKTIVGLDYIMIAIYYFINQYNPNHRRKIAPFIKFFKILFTKQKAMLITSNSIVNPIRIISYAFFLYELKDNVKAAKLKIIQYS